MIIKPKQDPHWGEIDDRGSIITLDRFLARSIQPPDKNHVSDWDFMSNFADRVVRTPQVALGGAVIVTSATATGTDSLANGDQKIFTLTTKTPASGILKNLTQVDMSLYVGTVESDGSTLLPGGSAVDESQWQVVGPWNDWHTTNNIYTVTRLYVRNISAGTQTLILKAKARTIASKNTRTPISST